MSGLSKFTDDADPAELVHGIVDELVRDFRQPAFRAGLAASMVSSVVLAKVTRSFVVSVVLSLMIGTAVEGLYIMAEDIHESVISPPGLIFHGFDCPGHTTGLPGESCMGGTDATGKV